MYHSHNIVGSYIVVYYTLRFYFPYLSLLAQLVTIFVYGPVVHFLYMDWPGTCIILDKKYNIANSSCHFGPYGSIEYILLPNHRSHMRHH